MSTVQEYAQQRASKFQKALRLAGNPLARVMHDWNFDVFYRFAVELQEQEFFVEFDAQDIAQIGMNEEKWISVFLLKAGSKLA